MNPDPSPLRGSQRRSPPQQRPDASQRTASNRNIREVTPEVPDKLEKPAPRPNTSADFTTQNDTFTEGAKENFSSKIEKLLEDVTASISLNNKAFWEKLDAYCKNNDRSIEQKQVEDALEAITSKLKVLTGTQAYARAMVETKFHEHSKQKDAAPAKNLMQWATTSSPDGQNLFDTSKKLTELSTIEKIEDAYLVMKLLFAIEAGRADPFLTHTINELENDEQNLKNKLKTYLTKTTKDDREELRAALNLHKLFNDTHQNSEFKEPFESILEMWPKETKPVETKKEANKPTEDLDNLDNIAKLKSGLTAKEERALQILSKSDGRTDSEKAFINKFLQDNYNNQDLHKTLSKIFKNENYPEGIKKNAVEFMYKLIFKARKSASLEKIIDKAEKIRTAMLTEPPPSVGKRDKLTIEEYTTLKSFHNLSKSPKLKDLLQEKNETPFNKLINNTHQAFTLYNFFEKEFQQSSKENYHHGDILTTDPKKDAILHSKKLSVLQKIVFKTITKYRHVGKIKKSSPSNDTDSKIEISEVNEKHVNYTFSILDSLTTDTFRINPSKLLTNKGKEILKDHKNPEEFINKKYQESEKELHEKGFHIENTDDRQIKAGLASIKPRGHKKKGSFDPEKVRTEITSTTADHKEEMICSEFAAKSTVAALLLLNDKLNEEFGLTGNNKIEFIKMPFSKNENLAKMHPERLIRQLKKAKCIEKVEPPKFCTDYFKEE